MLRAALAARFFADAMCGTLFVSLRGAVAPWQSPEFSGNHGGFPRHAAAWLGMTEIFDFYRRGDCRIARLASLFEGGGCANAQTEGVSYGRRNAVGVGFPDDPSENLTSMGKFSAYFGASRMPRPTETPYVGEGLDPPTITNHRRGGCPHPPTGTL